MLTRFVLRSLITVCWSFNPQVQLPSQLRFFDWPPLLHSGQPVPLNALSFTVASHSPWHLLSQISVEFSLVFQNRVSLTSFPWRLLASALSLISECDSNFWYSCCICEPSQTRVFLLSFSCLSELREALAYSLINWNLTYHCRHT